uniref:Uncharacterized protein n=1 Tax=Gouania willdenowi TaxID=441366 RepID=A0A8C5EED8_GOUWI
MFCAPSGKYKTGHNTIQNFIFFFVTNVLLVDMNPLSMACSGKSKWKNFLFYVIVQFICAFLGAAVVYGVYYKLSVWLHLVPPALWVGLVGIAILVVGIFAVTDRRNIGAPNGVEALAVGLVLLGISVSMGLKCGYPSGNNWWWIPVVGPMIGAFLYNLAIKLHHPKVEQEEVAEEDEDISLSERCRMVPLEGLPF